MLKNPQLKGRAFFWESGSTGILLIHGLTATTAEVRPLANYLLKKNYTITAPLLPGHNTIPEDLNKVRWTDWVNEVIDAYNILKSGCDNVYVGGESTGGLLALYLASEYSDIAGILTYAPALKLTLSQLDLLKLRLLAPFVPYVAKPDRGDNLPWKGYTVNPLKGVLQLVKLQDVVAHRLPNIEQPLLIIQGRKDPTVCPTVPDKILNNVNSEIVDIHWMEDSAHCVAIDCEWEQVADLTEKFINKTLSE